MCAVVGATAAVESPKRDSFAGGVYANPGSQHLYGIFTAGERVEGVAVGGPAYGHVLVSHPVPIYAPLKVVLTG